MSEDSERQGKQPMEMNHNILNGIITMSLVTLIIVWGVTGLTNGDALWFVRDFTAQADTITIYWDGEAATLTPGDPGYDGVMAAFAEGISHPGGFESQVVFSAEGMTQYRDKFRMVEMHFPGAVQVHTRHPFPKAATYLVPLDKTHAYYRRAFAFTGMVDYSAGALNIAPENFDALYQAVEAAAP